ncbi:hypothetical protein OGAPHI_000501 [Ogataea philodendri]|uniref:Uncharacterized protein n=1 Tax=Ogataea philodendri TaxID=1378263 RepID=A0A9P8PFE1_9ASCO|nr:uncharacterized protein OGAPHI_000501 [Ogataea philodendri]KAH3671278.1 hypothetical protein OGAPHI_000501 [Ogataea philodendri]
MGLFRKELTSGSPPVFTTNPWRYRLFVGYWATPPALNGFGSLLSNAKLTGWVKETRECASSADIGCSIGLVIESGNQSNGANW